MWSYKVLLWKNNNFEAELNLELKYINPVMFLKLRAVLVLFFKSSLQDGNFQVTFKIVLYHNCTVIMILRHLYIQ